MNRLPFFLFFILMNTVAHAQENEEIFNRLFEEIIITEDNASSMEELYQQLYYRYQYPINLNKATIEELQELVFLNDFQIEELIDHRDKTGDYTSIYELQALATFDIAKLKILSHFVYVKERSIEEVRKNHIITLYDTDFQKRKGYKDAGENNTAPYLGTRERMLMRMRAEVKDNVTLGFLADKDPGERLTVDPGTKRYGMDHYSGYALYRGEGSIKKAIIGDYQLQIGQGLVYSSGFSVGKSSGNLAQFRRITTGIRPHTSSLESGFLRGAAIEIKKKKLTFITFTSYNKHSVAVDDEGQSFASFNTSGFHRTRSELARKDNLGEGHAGMYVDYKSNGLQVGAGVSSINLDRRWVPTDRLYNILAFRGDRLNTIFTNQSYRWKNINLFSEQAYLANGGLGIVAGSILNLTRNIQSGFIYRNYQPDFTSLYGNALGEKSRNSNEQGVLWLFSWKLYRKASFSFYFDRFVFPWLSFRISKPSRGYEYLARFKYDLSRKSYILFQYKEEEKGIDVSTGQLVEVADNRRRQYQFMLHYPVDKRLTFRSRVQGSATTLNDGSGYAVIQDVFYSFSNFKLSSRYALFNTSDFNNRQYVYENDVLYAFSFPAYQGRGQRFYVMLRYKMNRNMKLWIRYAQTVYNDREEISGGNELIDGNRHSEIKLQLMYTF